MKFIQIHHPRLPRAFPCIYPASTFGTRPQSHQQQRHQRRLPLDRCHHDLVPVRMSIKPRMGINLRPEPGGDRWPCFIGVLGFSSRSRSWASRIDQPARIDAGGIVGARRRWVGSPGHMHAVHRGIQGTFLIRPVSYRGRPSIGVHLLNSKLHVAQVYPRQRQRNPYGIYLSLY